MTRVKDGLLCGFKFAHATGFCIAYTNHTNNWGDSQQWTSTFDHATQDRKESDTYC